MSLRVGRITLVEICGYRLTGRQLLVLLRVCMGKEALNESVRKRIEEITAGHDTVLFMKGVAAMPQCGFSAQVVHVLKTLGVDFHAVNVLADQEVREAIKVYNEWPTIPQLMHKGQFLGGCDIVTEMAESGELQEALGLSAAAG